MVVPDWRMGTPGLICLVPLCAGIYIYKSGNSHFGTVFVYLIDVTMWKNIRNKTDDILFVCVSTIASFYSDVIMTLYNVRNTHSECVQVVS